MTATAATAPSGSAAGDSGAVGGEGALWAGARVGRSGLPAARRGRRLGRGRRRHAGARHGRRAGGRDVGGAAGGCGTGSPGGETGPRPASSRSRRDCSAFADASTFGTAAFTSASSSWVRASEPSFIARRPTAIRSSTRTTSVGLTRPACSRSRSSCSAVICSSAGTSPSVCTTISARACASRSPKKRPMSRPESASRADGQQRRARVAGRDRVDRAEQQVGVGGAEHREHVGELDRGARVGEQLLQRPQRVAERAGRRAGDQRARLVGDRDLLRVGRAPQHRGDLGRPSGGRSRSGGSGRRPSAGPCWPRSWRARRSCAAAAPRAS